MKTTVKTAPQCGISVEPVGTTGQVRLVVVEGGFEMAVKVLNQDQAGVLLFGLEVAAEAARIAKDRADKAGSKYGHAGTCARLMPDGEPCGLQAPCPDCGPTLHG